MAFRKVDFPAPFVYGGDAKTAFFLTKLATRSVQFGVTFVIDVLVVWLLYKSKVFTAVKLWPPVILPRQAIIHCSASIRI